MPSKKPSGFFLRIHDTKVLIPMSLPDCKDQEGRKYLRLTLNNLLRQPTEFFGITAPPKTKLPS